MPIQQVLTQQRVPVKIWTDDVDERSRQQLANTASLPFVHHHVAAHLCDLTAIVHTLKQVVCVKG